MVTNQGGLRRVSMGYGAGAREGDKDLQAKEPQVFNYSCIKTL